MTELSYPVSPGRATSGIAYYLRVLRVVGVIEFKAKYAGAALGYLWSLAKPLAYFGVLWLVFAHLLRTANQAHDFTIFLLIGILLIFTRSTSRPEPRRQVGRSTSRPARNRYEYVWAGLRLLGDTLYVGVSSYCDQPGPDDLAAEGRLVAIDVQSGAEIARFDPVPGFGNLGGIWGWGGVSISPDGSGLFTGIGNAYVYDPSCVCHLETVGYGNSIVRLTPSLEPVASNRPQEVEDTPPGADIDFGAAPLLFQPGDLDGNARAFGLLPHVPRCPAHFEPEPRSLAGGGRSKPPAS